jgi:hypothetical protein
MTLRGLCTVYVVTAILTAASASAQRAAAAPDAPDAHGDRVSVKLAGSKGQMRGRLLHLDSQTLTIQEDRHDGDGRPARKRVDLPIANVLQIDVEEHDSLIDGAIFGAIYLAACAKWWCAQGADAPAKLPRDIYIGAGVGALVGAGLDAMLFKRSTIYKAGDPISPRPSSAGAGVSFRLKF